MADEEDRFHNPRHPHTLPRREGEDARFFVASVGNYRISSEGHVIYTLSGGAAISRFGAGSLIIDQLSLPFVEAIHESEGITTVSNLTSQLLLKHLSIDHGAVKYGTSGSMVNGWAMDIAHLLTGKRGVMTFYPAFHGIGIEERRVLTTRPEYHEYYINGEEGGRAHFHLHRPNPFVGPTEEAVLVELEQILKNHHQQIGLITFEIFSGSSDAATGASDAFWGKLTELVRQYDIMIHVDAIFDGMLTRVVENDVPRVFPVSRYIEKYAWDFVTLGKSLGGGLQSVSALVISNASKLKERLSMLGRTSTLLSTSMGGNPPAVARVASTLLTAEALLPSLQEKILFVNDHLGKLKARYPIIGRIERNGLHVGLHFVAKPPPAESDPNQVSFLFPTKINFQRLLLMHLQELGGHAYMGRGSQPEFTNPKFRQNAINIFLPVLPSDPLPYEDIHQFFQSENHELRGVGSEEKIKTQVFQQLGKAPFNEAWKAEIQRAFALLEHALQRTVQELASVIYPEWVEAIQKLKVPEIPPVPKTVVESLLRKKNEPTALVKLAKLSVDCKGK